MVEKITMWSYLEPLLYASEYTHLAEIARKLNKNHSTIRQYLNMFEKQGLLDKQIKGRLTLYKIKTAFPLIIDYLVLVEKEKLISKCKKDLLLNEIVYFLHNHLKENNKALIFGSATIDSRKANDIDILVTGNISIEKELNEFEKKFNIKIHLINVKDLKLIDESLKKEITTKHLIIQGSEEIIKWLI